MTPPLTPTPEDVQAAEAWANENGKACTRTFRESMANDYLAGLLAGRERAALTWSETPPAVPGWWWFQEPDSGPVIGFIRVDSDGEWDCHSNERLCELKYFAPGTLWAGPILLPPTPPADGGR